VELKDELKQMVEIPYDKDNQLAIAFNKVLEELK